MPLDTTIKPTEDQIKEVYACCAAGRAAWKAGNIAEAEASFIKGWEILPEPRERCDYFGQSLSTGFVNFYRDTGQFEKAIDWLERMRKAYGSSIASDCHIGFLAGTLYFEAGNLDKAAEFFLPLYDQFKSRPFAEENPKYLAFTRKAAKARKPPTYKAENL